MSLMLLRKAGNAGRCQVKAAPDALIRPQGASSGKIPPHTAVGSKSSCPPHRRSGHPLGFSMLRMAYSAAESNVRKGAWESADRGVHSRCALLVPARNTQKV
eukprot:6347900-Amphidinium_carterae.1